MEAARHARPSDLEAIAVLATEARDELEQLRGGDVWRLQSARTDPIAVSLGHALERSAEEGLVVVGTVHEVVVGYGVSTIEVVGEGERLAVVTDLYTHPEARGIGIGEAMMNLLIDHAVATGALGIDSLALPGDRATKNFFETFGLKARAIVVHRSLLPAEGRTEETGAVDDSA